MELFIDDASMTFSLSIPVLSAVVYLLSSLFYILIIVCVLILIPIIWVAVKHRKQANQNIKPMESHKPRTKVTFCDEVVVETYGNVGEDDPEKAGPPIQPVAAASVSPDVAKESIHSLSVTIPKGILKNKLSIKSQSKEIEEQLKAPQKVVEFTDNVPHLPPVAQI